MPSEPAPTVPSRDRLSIAIVALGGQGGGVLADWLVDVAESYGWLVQTTSVPGVAQRTGSTVYYLETTAPPTAGSAEPVLALMPVPGDVDLVVAPELMEAGRAIARGLVTPDRTTLIASSHRVYGITEKSAAFDGIADPQPVLAAMRSEARKLVLFDMERACAETGSVVSSVLCGAIAASDALPFPRALYEHAIRHGGVAVEANLAGFAAGWRRA
ncbi:MAG: 2-oxoacid:acceptor oxidoreductase family protein, partial [Gammaproteobacteria bacterium]|nr:2-oxoacid:acceptor oxidoreductase family protein [Gammaproteobacteria bacterium]